MQPSHAAAFEMSATTRGRSGQILIFGTLSLVFLFTVVGLAVDVGYAFMVKRRAQTAADAAAIGAAVYARVNGDACGANGVTCGNSYTCADPPVSPPTNSLQAGCLYASQNGFLNDGTSQRISLIENNTTLGSGLTPSIWIQATVSQQYSNNFLIVGGFNGGYSTATATSGVAGTPGAQCAYVLGTSAGGGGGLIDSASGNLSFSNCGVYSNDGIDQTGSGAVSATNGGIYTYGTNTYNSAKVTPAPTAEAATAADPFANLPKPTVPTTCDHTNYNNTAGGAISHGTYCRGMQLSGGSADYTLGAGIYYIVGGGLSFSSSKNITGSGVMFYLTCNATYTAHASTLSGSGSISITAPTSGPYIGILMYQDPSCPTGTNTISASGASNSTGALYFPNTELDFSGSGGTTYLSIVAFTLKYTGSGALGLQRDTTGTVVGLRSSWLMQ